MNKRLKISLSIGFIFTVLLGTLLHFIYEWTNYNLIVGAFSPVNESTWEHLKLIFYPSLIFIIFTGPYYYKKYKNYLSAFSVGLIISLLSIIILFYTYTGIIGRNYLIMDISIFFISSFILYFVSFYIITKKESLRFTFIINLTILTVLLIIFILFSYYPPDINLFKIP